MVVYWEYAFLENALLDGLLLCLALKCVRARVRPAKLLFAAASGGAFAVVFPLLALPVWAAYVVKFASGVVLVLLAGSGKRAKPYCMTTAVFFALTFAFGGLLTAVYSFFGIETVDGTGFYLERAPVALIAGGAVNSDAPRAAVYALCFADPFAWMAADAVLLVPFLRNIMKMDYRYLKGTM